MQCRVWQSVRSVLFEPRSTCAGLNEYRTFLRLRGFLHMGQNSFEIDMTYLMLVIILIVLGAGVISVDSILGF